MAGKRHRSAVAQPTSNQSGEARALEDLVDQACGIKKLRVSSPLYTDDTSQYLSVKPSELPDNYSEWNKLLRVLHHERRNRQALLPRTPRHATAFQGGHGTPLYGRNSLISHESINAHLIPPNPIHQQSQTHSDTTENRHLNSTPLSTPTSPGSSRESFYSNHMHHHQQFQNHSFDVAQSADTQTTKQETMYKLVFKNQAQKNRNVEMEDEWSGQRHASSLPTFGPEDMNLDDDDDLL